MSRPTVTRVTFDLPECNDSNFFFLKKIKNIQKIYQKKRKKRLPPREVPPRDGSKKLFFTNVTRYRAAVEAKKKKTSKEKEKEKKGKNLNPQS